MSALSGRILVTGGAGFIGSALVWALNQRGYTDILVADYLGQDEKWRNLTPLKFGDYLEAEVARAREQKATVVHWLVRTEDVAGSAAAVQAFTPPRLRGASAARDAEVSAHVALASMLPQPWQGAR